MGKLSFNRLVQQDLINILEYYERETGERLVSERFFDQYRNLLDRIVEKPARFSLHRLGTRLARFGRFPYSVVYRVTDDSDIRILFIRHEKRHPALGKKRK